MTTTDDEKTSLRERTQQLKIPNPLDINSLGQQESLEELFNKAKAAHPQQDDKVKEAINNAVKLYHSAAEQGYAWAQYDLGTCYQHGIGVKKDPKEAIRLYHLAAKQGHSSTPIVDNSSLALQTQKKNKGRRCSHDNLSVFLKAAYELCSLAVEYAGDSENCFESLRLAFNNLFPKPILNIIISNWTI